MTVYVDVCVCMYAHTHVFIKFHYDTILSCVPITQFPITVISLRAV